MLSASLCYCLGLTVLVCMTGRAPWSRPPWPLGVPAGSEASLRRGAPADRGGVPSTAWPCWAASPPLGDSPYSRRPSAQNGERSSLCGQGTDRSLMQSCPPAVLPDCPPENGGHLSPGALMGCWPKEGLWVNRGQRAGGSRCLQPSPIFVTGELVSGSRRLLQFPSAWGWPAGHTSL